MRSIEVTHIRCGPSVLVIDGFVTLMAFTPHAWRDACYAILTHEERERMLENDPGVFDT